MTLRDYFEVLARRKWVAIITFVVMVALAVAVTFMTAPVYRASALMRVLAVRSGSSDWISYDTGQIERLINTYAEFAGSRPVLKELVDRLELRSRPHIEVVPVVGTELMQITAEAEDPVVARDAANALADILIARSRALYTGGGKSAQEILGEQLAQVRAELDQAWTEYENVVASAPDNSELIAASSRAIQLKEQTYGELLDQYERNRVREAVLDNTLSVLETAVAPGQPARPRKELNLALGVVFGLVAGTGLAFLIESLDTTLYSTDQIQRASQLPVLGKVPSGGKQDQPALFSGNSTLGEAFRRLRTTFLTLKQDGALDTVLVTSAEPREGKSTVVANLGYALAQSGRRVILVDAHLRLPTLHKIFSLSNRVGLSSVLEGRTDLHDAVQPTELPGVDVLTSGPLPAMPAELVSSPQMEGLLAQLADEYDQVLLDTPSLLPVTDAAALSPSVDGVLVVVERGSSQQESVRAARQQLGDVRAETIGVVVNRAKAEGIHDYYRRLPTTSSEPGHPVWDFLAGLFGGRESTPPLGTEHRGDTA